MDILQFAFSCRLAQISLFALVFSCDMFIAYFIFSLRFASAQLISHIMPVSYANSPKDVKVFGI